jgi:hypothetical protein
MHIGEMILNHPHLRGTASRAVIECVEAAVPLRWALGEGASQPDVPVA